MAVPLNGPMHRYIWTPSLWAPGCGQQFQRYQRHTGRKWSIQHQGESWGSVFSQTEVLATGHCPFPEPSPHRATEPAGRYHTWVSINWLTVCHTLVVPWGPCPTQLSGISKLFPVAFLCKWLVLAHASGFPKFSETSSIWLQWRPYLYLSWSCPRPNTSSSWL